MIENKSHHIFWQSGNGKDFLTWADVKASEIPSGFDTRLFHHFDEEGDALVSGWMKNGDFKNVMNALSGKPSENTLPDNFLSLKEKHNQPPAWVNNELIEEAGGLSQRSGLTALLVLRDFALLGGYYFVNLTKPLVATGALEKGAVHRLYNTLHFWVEVSRTSAQARDTRVDACLKTRFIHSASRLMIQKKYPDWDFGKLGTPINHADMVATSMAFTLYFLYGLEKLNFGFSQKEEEGVFHLWKYITWLMGVPENILPDNRKEAVEFFFFWTKYQGAPDKDSLKLAAALLNENTPVSLLKSAIIRNNMGYIHKSISNYLIDDNVKSILKIPGVRFKNVFPGLLRFKNKMPVNREKQISEGHEEQLSVLEDYRKNA